jgi:hypothetical protein
MFLQNVLMKYLSQFAMLVINMGFMSGIANQNGGSASDFVYLKLLCADPAFEECNLLGLFCTIALLC